MTNQLPAPAQRLDDPAIMRLPHPVRIDTALGEPIETFMLKETGIFDAVQPYLADEGTSTEWIVNRVPGMRELALASVGAPASLNMGVLMLMLSRARLRAHGDPILQVAPALQAQLAETDLGAGLPARFFRCPYPIVYIQFARPSGLEIRNRASGLHEVEGVYVGNYQVPPSLDREEPAGRAQVLGLDPARVTRVMELTITGSPIGKRNALDDASVDISLFIQDEDACLSTLLDRHMDYYRSPAVTAQPGFEVPASDDMALAGQVIFHLAKVLLYLNLPEAHQEPLPERSALARRLRGLGKKKAARIARRMATAYDRIIIGPRVEVEREDAADAAGGDPDRSPRPHWRRGHFRRIRYGEGFGESRLGWIRPVLVNASRAFGAVNAKPYVVR